MEILKWFLIASAILVFFAGTIGYIIILIKTSKLKQNYNTLQQVALKEAEMSENKVGREKVLARSNHGELLWDFLKDEMSENTPLLEAPLIETSINTIIRNQYKNGLVWNDTNGFSSINIFNKTKIPFSYAGTVNAKKIALNNEKYKANVTPLKSKETFDYIIIQGDKKNLNQQFDKSFKLLNKKGLILIDNIDSKSKDSKREIKELLQYLKMSGHRYETKISKHKYLFIAK